MRITFVINSLEGGGAERVLATVLQQWVALGNRDHVLDLVLLDDLPRKYPLPDSLPVPASSCRHCSNWQKRWEPRSGSASRAICRTRMLWLPVRAHSFHLQMRRGFPTQQRRPWRWGHWW